MTHSPVRLAAILLFSLACSTTMTACGSKESGSDMPKIAAGADVPPPAGKQWSDVVNATPESGFVMGNPNAAAKLVEYGSYTCSHCRDFTAEAAEPLRKMVDTGRLSYEFRSFLRDPYDMAMAMIARCGGAETFFPMTEQLFGNQNAFFDVVQKVDENRQKAIMSLPPEKRFIALAQSVNLIDFAKQRGMAEDKVNQCLADSKTGERLVTDAQEGGKQYAISGTPT